jgi:hypothetical protein
MFSFHGGKVLHIYIYTKYIYMLKPPASLRDVFAQKVGGSNLVS